MPSGITNKGPSVRPVLDPSAVTPPDAGLSAAFRHALGGKPAESHLPGASPKRGRELAKLAKADRPAAAEKGSPRNVHIGPRSGHK